MKKQVYIIRTDEKQGVTAGREHMYIEAVDLVSINDEDEATVRIKMYDGSERERKLDQEEYFLSELDAYEALFGILTEDIYVVEYRIQCLREGRPYTWQPHRDEE